ncbi:hypothetical protein B0T10DRAFT_480241 [Thelonectria olida]|uniref:Nucleotide-binding, alpha-beta plait n=1 Tax=Thelonectria olida TaxID=1576542 RepID=A0A9P8WAP2_9HYPO|nr:hypothetical protein B0T10DRAFT_480241 [Thelonectria olida]
MPTETPSSDGATDFTRLHISPLDPELLKIVLPAAVATHARNISYHTIETFPERRYGYVELPNMEADKLKKKLNGTTLKGNKIRIEKARPEQRLEPTGTELDELDFKEKKKKSKKAAESAEGSRKRKRDRDVIEGVALTDRKVKRGWTEPADQRRKKSKKDKEKEKDGKTTEKKKRQKSKYTDQEECLLKMKLPPDAVSNLTEDNLPKKRKKKGNARDITVHEFEKTTKFPSFLKTAPESQSKAGTEFVEGKGWVDEEGNVVEAVKARPTPSPAAKTPRKSKPIAKKVVEGEGEDDDSTSDSGTSSSGTSSDEESDEESEAQSKPEKGEAKFQETKDNKKSDSDDESSSDDSEAPAQATHTTPISAIKADHSRPMSASSTRSLTIKIPPPITPSASKVHPLEALYKRPNAGDNFTETPAHQAQPFSFFSGDDVEEEETGEQPNPTVPMTPYTRQDLEWRGTRSAAPTPDTAHPTRMRNFWTEEDDADMDDVAEEDEDDEQAQPSSQGQVGTSEFQSWFWENRRDLNRSWMTRRKTAAKEKRHRENKARASKAV